MNARTQRPFWGGGVGKVTEDPQQGQDVLQLLEVIRASKAKQPINIHAQTALPGQVWDIRVVEADPESGLNQLSPTESGVSSKDLIGLEGWFVLFVCFFKPHFK